MNRAVGILIVLVAFALPLNVAAFSTIVNAKITKLSPRVGNYTVPLGTKAFFFEINGTYTNTCGGASPSAYYGIDNTIMDNTQYRDHVTTAQLAFTMDKTVNIYTDGCIGGFIRVVGIDAF